MKAIRAAILPALALGFLSGGAASAVADPLAWQESGSGLHLRILGGKAFAADGKHGGGGFGILADVETGNWVTGAEFLFIGEPSAIMGIDRIQPLEEYRLLGAFSGRQWRSGPGIFTAGLGAGMLWGLRRTGLLRTEEDCKGWHWFGDCPEEDVIVLEHHGSRRFSAVALGPLLAAEVRMGRTLSVGVRAQAVINREQGLGLLSLVLGFGP